MATSQIAIKREQSYARTTAEMIRYRLEVLYPTTIVIRLLISATLIGLFLRTSDPFFLVILAVVAVGIALTAVSYVLDRRASAVAA